MSPDHRKKTLLACTLAVACQAHAASDENDLLKLNLRSGVVSDSNVYRSPASPLPGRKPVVSDSSVQYQLGARLQQQFSRQQLTLDAQLTQTDYRRLDELDHQRYEGALAWGLQWGNALGGNLALSHRKRMGDFKDNASSRPDFITGSGQRLDLNWQPHSAWSGLMAAELSQERHSVQSALDYDQRLLEAGGRYRTPRGSSVLAKFFGKTLDYRQDNRTPGSVSRDETQRGIRWQMNWPASSKTTLALGGSHYQRCPRQGAACRSLDNASANISWQASAHSQLGFTLAREDRDPGQALNAGQLDRWELTWRWTLGEKLLATARWSEEKVRNEPPGNPRTELWYVGLTHQWHRALQLEGYAQKQRRRSPLSSLAYDADMLGLNVQIDY